VWTYNPAETNVRPDYGGIGMACDARQASWTT